MSVFDTALLTGIAIFCIGLAGVVIRRSLLVILLALELMLAGANLVLVAWAGAAGRPEVQLFAMLVFGMAAVEIAVGLALLIAIFRMRGCTDADSITELKL